MKKNKAVKRLTKIEALLSEVTARYSAGASHIQEALQNAKAAVIRAKEAMSVQVSAVAHAAVVAGKVARGAKPPRKKRHKKATAKGPIVQTAKKGAAIEKVGKKAAAKTPRTRKVASKKTARNKAIPPAQGASEPSAMKSGNT